MAVSVVLLAAVLAFALSRPSGWSEAVVAVPAAALVVAVGAVSVREATAEVQRLRPVVAFLAAVLVLLPLVSGRAAVLAVLIGVNIGPNLTYVGSLANLLWRRVLHQQGEPTPVG